MSFLRPAYPVLVLGVLVASSALAAPRDRIVTSRSASTSAVHPTQTTTTTPTTSYSGPTTWGLGVWSSDQVTVGDTISALFSSGDNWIQPFFSIAGTRGSFEFNVGGSYRVTVAGSSKSGFHFAPGIALGSVNTGAGTGNKFAFSFFGLAGGHYAIFDRLIFAFDGGPILSVVDGDLDFKIRPAGAQLGMSLHYLF
jgi:hypothetical protein